MGFFAGVDPAIKLTHLIAKNKSSVKHLAKLFYGSAASNLPAYYQSFPKQKTTTQLPTTFDVIKKLYYLLRAIALKKGFREAYFQYARYLGEIEGLQVFQPALKKVSIIRLSEKILGLK
ncbi:MAG: hypothetical protein H7321_08735 [Bacteroidia bacterium]|nr:hypothetical protein [Bacteroidia bacterium]